MICSLRLDLWVPSAGGKQRAHEYPSLTHALHSRTLSGVWLPPGNREPAGSGHSVTPARTSLPLPHSHSHTHKCVHTVTHSHTYTQTHLQMCPLATPCAPSTPITQLCTAASNTHRAIAHRVTHLPDGTGRKRSGPLMLTHALRMNPRPGSGDQGSLLCTGCRGSSLPCPSQERGDSSPPPSRRPS